MVCLVSEERFNMKSRLEDLALQMQNPFLHIRNWVKGEILEVHAVLESISKKEGMEALKMKAESTLRSDKNKVASLSAGKFVLSSMFKGKDSKAAETQRILEVIS